jgi:hypothetical protein
MYYKKENIHKHNLILWKPPSQGCVKLNTDAAVKDSYSLYNNCFLSLGQDTNEFFLGVGII